MKKTISTPLLVVVLVIALIAIIYYAIEYATRSSSSQTAKQQAAVVSGEIPVPAAAPPADISGSFLPSGEGGATTPPAEPAQGGGLPPPGGIGEIAIPAGAETPPVNTPQSEPSAQAPAAASMIIEYNGSAYAPTTIEVKRGESVTFMNRGSGEMWPASALHPTHTAYPGTDSKKCGSGEMIFDACKGFAAGASWSFVFDKVGTWNFHDHLNPGARGTVIVK